MAGESQQLPAGNADPTVFTTEAIERSENAQREWTIAQLDVIRERLRGIDVATRLLNETVNRTPTDIQKEITHLRELTEVELRAVDQRFIERDVRSERESRDNRVAVDAAFAAQKEAAAKQDDSNQKAIDKSERATAETLNRLQDQFKTTTDNLRASIDDLKVAVGAIQNMKLGGTEAKAGAYAAIGLAVALILAAIAIVGVVVANGQG